MTRPKREKPIYSLRKRIRPWRNEEFLRLHYVERQETSQYIADLCGVSQNTVLNNLRKLGIERRPQGWAGHVG